MGEFQPQGCTPATRWHTSSMCHACALCSAHIVHTSCKFQPQGYTMCTLATRRRTRWRILLCAVQLGNLFSSILVTRGGLHHDIVMSMLPHRLVHVGQDAKVLTPHNMQRSAGGQWWVVTFSNWNIVSHSPSSEGGPSYCTCVNLQKKTKEQFV